MSEWGHNYDEADETEYAQGRRPDKTYLNKSFRLQRPGSDDDGKPARFICKVFDPTTGSTIEREADEYVIRESPGGRYQVKLLVAGEPGNVKDIWIQRVPTSGGGQIQTHLHLPQPEAGKLIDLIKSLDAFPVEGGTTVRLDDDLLQDLLSDPSSLTRLYNRVPEQVRALIRDDAAARDVLALRGRRAELDRFRRLLDDDEFFDAEVGATGRRRPEDVWQQLFEANPWMLGLTLSGQLLTSWSHDKLEQIVAGASISGSGKRVDALLRTAGRIRSMVFAEIKTHRTLLLDGEYRSGCWSISRELAGAIAQVQGTMHLAAGEIGDRLDDLAEDGSEVPGAHTYLLRPRGFVIAGDLSQLTGLGGGDHPDKVRSFELFRRELQEPEVLTFDEVFARAEGLLELAQEES